FSLSYSIWATCKLFWLLVCCCVIVLSFACSVLLILGSGFYAVMIFMASRASSMSATFWLYVSSYSSFVVNPSDMSCRQYLISLCYLRISALKSATVFCFVVCIVIAFSFCSSLALYLQHYYTRLPNATIGKGLEQSPNPTSSLS